MIRDLPDCTAAKPLPAALSIINASADAVMGTEALIGVGGLPMSTPHFSSPGEQTIRHDREWSDYTIGPNVPRHWYDGGAGWVTKYFYDSVPRDMLRQEPGKYRCQVLLKDGQRCDHEISDTDCCKGNFCWTPLATAPLQMDEHVRTVHGAAPPPRRQWSSSLFAFEGWGEACLCGPCLGARQVTAVAGWEDTFHCGWCFLFSFFGLGRVSFYPAIMS